MLPPEWENDGIHQYDAPEFNRAIAFAIYHRYRHFFRFDNLPGPYQKTVNADDRAQSFGRAIYDTLKGAARLSAASAVASYRDTDLANAPVVVFEGAAGSAKTFQLPCAKYQRAGERLNTEVMRQRIVNLTSDSQNITIQYYQRDVSNTLTTLGGTFLIPPGTARTICNDGTSVWSEQPELGASLGWAADTGTAKKTANATYSGSAEAAYTQATIQTLMNAVRDNSQTIKALKDALMAAKVLIP